MKKKYVIYFTVFTCMMVGMTGCSASKKEKDNPSATEVVQQEKEEQIEEQKNQENPEEDQTEQSDPMEQTDDVEANIGTIGYSKGDIYYRRYSENAVEKSGLFGEYEHKSAIPKKMIKQSKDGTVTELFDDTGVGNVIVANDHFYLTTSEYQDGKIYQLDMNGTKREELGSGYIVGIDRKLGYLICQGELGLYTICMSTGKSAVLDADGTFVTENDGAIYYYVIPEDIEAARNGKVILKSIKTDGTDGRTIIETKADLYEYCDTLTSVVDLQVVDDVIYFNYGGYAGTGNYFQGGQLIKVNKDGSDPEVILPKDLYMMENFYVSKEGEDTVIYYGGQESRNYMKYYVSTKTTEETSIPFDAEKQPETDDKGLYVYDFTSKEKQYLMTSDEYNRYGFDKISSDEEKVLNYNHIEKIGESVYFEVAVGTHDAQNDIGWRYSYLRDHTYQFMKDMVTGTLSLLYEY